MVLWDGKNDIYALKVEVGVMAMEPHYALFISHNFLGRKHDYQEFKAGAIRCGFVSFTSSAYMYVTDTHRTY